MTSTLELLDSLAPVVRDTADAVRVAVIPDTRSPLLEFRVGVSAAGTPSPDGRALAAVLVGQSNWASLTEAIADSGGACAVEDRGEWAIVHGHVLPWDTEWLEALTRVLDGLGGELVRHEAALAALPVSDPAQAAWDAASGRGSSTTPRAVAVLAGPADEPTAAALAESLERIVEGEAGTQTPSRRRTASPWHHDAEEVVLWLGGREPHGDVHGCARFLGTGLLTAAPTSKLIRRLPSAPGRAERIMVGRDVRFGAPRVFGVAQIANRDVAPFVEWVQGTIADPSAWDVDQAAFDALGEYCVANIAEAFESPRALCEATAESLMRGAQASWLADLTRGIPHVSLAEAQAAADATFARLGDVVAVHSVSPAG